MALAAAAGAFTGCGGGGTSATSAGTQSDEPASSVPIRQMERGCGSMPLPAPKDPDGVLASLPARYHDTYAGYIGNIRRSPWASWKPKHGPPYKVAISYALLSNTYQSDALDVLKAELEKNPDVGEVVVRTLSSVNVPEQIQQFNSLLQTNPDIIIAEPLQAEPFVPLVNRAAAKGIPTIVLQGSIPTPNAVNVQANNYVAAGQAAAGMVQLLGSKGNVLLMHGFPTVDVDAQEFEGFRAVLARCPGIKVVGETLGAFSPATAKEQTLKFLATHPVPVHGVLQTALMSAGIMSGFEQTGRDMPVVTDIAAQKGSLGYWRENRGDYQGVGIGLGAAPISLAVAGTVRRMLDGRGPKLTDLTDRLPLITDENLDDWAEPGWTLRTPGQADGPENEFLTEEYLDPLFNAPS
jgi:ribose transport system substrate-binding protein